MAVPPRLNITHSKVKIMAFHKDTKVTRDTLESLMVKGINRTLRHLPNSRAILPSTSPRRTTKASRLRLRVDSTKANLLTKATNNPAEAITRSPTADLEATTKATQETNNMGKVPRRTSKVAIPISKADSSMLAADGTKGAIETLHRGGRQSRLSPVDGQHIYSLARAYSCEIWRIETGSRAVRS